MKKLSKIFLFLFITLLLSVFISCSVPQTNNSTKADLKTETTIEATSVETKPIETKSVDTTAENKDFELFLEAIKEYNPIGRAVEYATIVYQIALDYADENNKDYFLNKEKAGLRYGDLHSKIQNDYMVLELIEEKILEDKGISEITPEMIRAVDLINDWSNKLELQYEYTAKYYWGEGAEYEIKADELAQEADEIMDEYIDLLDSIKNR